MPPDFRCLGTAANADVGHAGLLSRLDRSFRGTLTSDGVKEACHVSVDVGIHSGSNRELQFSIMDLRKSTDHQCTTSMLGSDPVIVVINARSCCQCDDSSNSWALSRDTGNAGSCNGKMDAEEAGGIPLHIRFQFRQKFVFTD